MKILFALPGLHRVNRGAEVAFIEVARQLALTGDEVTLIGSGPERSDEPYRFRSVPAMARERFERVPTFPFFRGDTAWEEASFIPGLLRAYRPADYDVTLTCSFPFVNMTLRRPVLRGKRPPHVFVTQNGDWPAFSNRSEYRAFGCEGLVCINPDYAERNRDRFRTVVIPNGVDLSRFRPGPPERARLGLPEDKPIVLMVSALIPSKNVIEAVEAMANVPDAFLIVAGDGPLRDEVEAAAELLIPGRYRRISVPADDMPSLYRSVDSFLHLSRDESFGNVYVEALATGLPIVAYDLPRTRWIIGDHGIYAREERRNLAAKIRSALEPGRKIADAQPADARKYGWDIVAAQYRQFLKDVVQSDLERGQNAASDRGSAQ